LVQRAVVDGDRRELARDRHRPAAASGEVRDVQRHGFRFRRQPLTSNPIGEGRKIAPVGGVGALACGGAAGFGGRPGVGAQLVDRRLGVGGKHAKRRFFCVVERFGGDRHASPAFDTGLVLTSEKRTFSEVETSTATGLSADVRRQKHNKCAHQLIGNKC
jgi:hypothetical protein